MCCPLFLVLLQDFYNTNHTPFIKPSAPVSLRLSSFVQLGLGCCSAKLPSLVPQVCPPTVWPANAPAPGGQWKSNYDLTEALHRFTWHIPLVETQQDHSTILFWHVLIRIAPKDGNLFLGIRNLEKTRVMFENWHVKGLGWVSLFRSPAHQKVIHTFQIISVPL